MIAKAVRGLLNEQLSASGKTAIALRVFAEENSAGGVVVI